ncbi:MAG: TerB N-terminal domain-containing protein [Candidatus Microthrix sp.]|nr:TerB N-terminal domain-containing protein [Candidatus Microthrix sp.]
MDGQVIAGGLLYVGSRARSGDGQTFEPALIDPSLPVQWRRPDLTGATMGYWPSYGALDPSARAGYLNWLLGGRSDPNAYIGFVFLYFYGFERRFLVDLGSNSNHPDAALITAEVLRLLAIYGDNGSFQMYAGRFLALIETISAMTAPVTPPAWASVPRSWEIPPVVRVGLGRYVAAKQPIPAEWALAFLRLHPEANLRTPATRCTDEFDELFVQRYRAKFGDGIVARIPKARVEVHYQPASGGLRGDYRQRLEDVPDVCASKALFDKIREVEASCTDSLDAYSRFLGRNPDGASEPAALGLLPDELLATRGGATLDSLRTWGATLAEQGAVAVLLDDVVQRWAPGRTEKLTKKDAVSLASLLAKFNIGIEPDVRFGGKTPTPGSTAVVFILPDQAPAAPSAPYAAAAALVHLTAVVASSDGSIDDGERLHLARHLEASLELDGPERARLNAHFTWLTVGKPSLTGVKTKVNALSVAQRSAIGLFLVDLAAADGVVSPEEITTLTKLYKLLGIDESELYRTVHTLGTDTDTDTGPLTVRTADYDAPRHAIPAPDPAGTGIRLDPAKVQARMAETATVTALLADIFTEEDPPADPVPSAPSPDDSDGVTIEGLDSAHSALAAHLLAQTTWERADAEKAAGNLGLLMLAGAIDRINEAAMDICGEPLIDGDDPLELNHYAAQELYE